VIERVEHSGQRGQGGQGLFERWQPELGSRRATDG
jgi:hypothetical protein